jgi:hypothetical protein
VTILFQETCWLESLHEDLGEDLGSCTHGNSTLSRKWMCAVLLIFALISTHNSRTTQCTTQGKNIAISITTKRKNDGYDVAKGVNHI